MLKHLFAYALLLFVGEAFGFADTLYNKSLIYLADSSNVEMLPMAKVDATLMKTISWEKQPYRTSMKLVAPSVGSNSRSVPELLMHQTGVLVQKTNHGGGSPTLRGVLGNQVLMMVDGIRLNNSIFRYGPNQYLNTLDVFALSKMEVLFGSGSIQYGSDAIGGVVMSNYHEPALGLDKKWSPKVVLGGMSGNQELSSRLGLDYSDKKFALSVGFSQRKFGDIILSNRDRLLPTGYRELNYDMKLVVKANRGKWIFAHQNNNQFDVPVFHKISLENYQFFDMDLQLRSLTYLKREWHHLSSIIDNLEITVGQQGQGEWRSFKKNNSIKQREEQDSVDTRFAVMKLFGKNSKGLQWVTGIDLYADHVFSQRRDLDLTTGSATTLRPLYPNDAKNVQTSGFAYVTKNYSKLLFRIGGRYSLSNIKIENTDLGVISDFNQALVYEFSSSYQLGKGLSIYGSKSTSFRSPNIDDLGTLGIVDFRYEVPQYGLTPEYGNNREMGLKYKRQKLTVGLAIFQNNLSGLITRVKSISDSIQGYPVYQKQNIGSSRLRGLEIDFSWVPSDKVKFRGGGSLLIGDNISANEPMRRIPPKMLNLEVSYRINDRFELSCFAYGAGEQKRLASGDIQDNRIGISGTPGYFSADLKCKFNFNKLYLNVGLLNLCNETYKTHGSGVYMPGRSVQLVLGYL